MSCHKVCLYIIIFFQLIAFNARGMIQDSTNVASESTIKVTGEVNLKEVPLNRTVTYSVIVEWSGDIKRYMISEIENPVGHPGGVHQLGRQNKQGDCQQQKVVHPVHHPLGKDVHIDPAAHLHEISSQSGDADGKPDGNTDHKKDEKTE